MIPTRGFDEYIRNIHETDTEKVEIPKSEVSELPEEFEESYPANAMQNDGAIASYRDDNHENSIHVIEYEDYWEAHIDEVNPKHDSIGHLVTDAPLEAAGVALIILVGVAKHYEIGTFGD